MSSIIFYQCAIMLLLIIVGMFCAKIGFISEKCAADLSKVLLQIVNPVMIFLSYKKEFKKDLLINLGTAALLSLLSFAILIIISEIFFSSKKQKDSEVEKFSSIYSNCGFMGIPLVNAAFGYDGIFYLTAYLTVFNLLAWSHGVIIMSGKKDLKSVLKVFRSPTMIAIYLGLIMFFTKFKLPSLITDFAGYIADLNTPLAMLVAGATVYRSNILESLKDLRVWVVCAVRLILSPILVIILCLLLPFDKTVETTIILVSAAPSATMVTLFAITYNKNSKFASRIFALTTILSCLTMPVLIWLQGKLM